MALEKCPVCNATVKQENLREHYARVHPKRLGTLKRAQTPQASRPTPGRSHRKILLAVLVMVLLVGVTAYVLRPGGQSQEEPPSSAAPLTVEVSPSTMSIAGTGILSFNVTLTPRETLSSSVVLSVPNKPLGVINVFFEPNSLGLGATPGTSKATLVIGRAFASGTYPMRVVANVGSAVAEATVSLQISNPSPSKPFYLVANSSGWNYTDSGGGNPPILVRQGETFNLTAISIPNDIHHYLGIYAAGTPPSQVNEQSTGYYVRTDFQWSHYPGNETITFTSWITGTLEYYCDSHPTTMHGIITVTP